MILRVKIIFFVVRILLLLFVQACLCFLRASIIAILSRGEFALLFLPLQLFLWYLCAILSIFSFFARFCNSCSSSFTPLFLSHFRVFFCCHYTEPVLLFVPAFFWQSVTTAFLVNRWTAFFLSYLPIVSPFITSVLFFYYYSISFAVVMTEISQSRCTYTAF